jgi:hypothetical protein
MFTRRSFVNGALGVGAGLALAERNSQAAPASTGGSQNERNKAVVRRFMESQGTKDETAVMREVRARTSGGRALPRSTSMTTRAAKAFRTPDRTCTYPFPTTRTGSLNSCPKATWSA